NIDALFSAIRARDRNAIFEVFMNQPLCSTLTVAEGKELFAGMVRATHGCLAPYYDLGGIE
ncbi:MAG: alpha-glucosidase/alpha-galactosidase, partial [Clostridia bacterium]|nr:alpha-glucosidase/alpha-galactosidase [Clostridia bacterium]